MTRGRTVAQPPARHDRRGSDGCRAQRLRTLQPGHERLQSDAEELAVEAMPRHSQCGISAEACSARTSPARWDRECSTFPLPGANPLKPANFAAAPFANRACKIARMIGEVEERRRGGVLLAHEDQRHLRAEELQGNRGLEQAWLYMVGQAVAEWTVSIWS